MSIQGYFCLYFIRYCFKMDYIAVSSDDMHLIICDTESDFNFKTENSKRI